ncbi:MAG: acetyl-CoA carboxylase biotin carboxylase subunit [Candidatus Sumerlaeia bacterium]|nr:acetyl-CoA carboxylase biotin carboxylase subunit [Candidatus Sumerlaeia bacterium]
MIKKVLVANRGEIALRVIRACKELGLQTVAVYSTADAESLHVHAADEAVCIGPPQSVYSYLVPARIIAAAEITGADAIHPGYGFLSEKADFARACADNNIVFIGPMPRSIELMGDKATARETAIAAQCPVVPGTKGILKDAAEGLERARKIGFPVMIKATAGGGGRGMRIAKDERSFAQMLQTAQTEAGAAFGNPDVYVEKCIISPKHVEVQVLGDNHGNIVYLGERECSVQRRHQKLVEEGPSSVVTPELRRRMGEAAVRAARQVDYRGAGTVEFLLDKSGEFYFMEMNTRIQVEHPVTEMITSVDLVRWQILVAMGEKLAFKQDDITIRGHAIECRINAEDPAKNFMPCPGKLTDYVPPGGPGVRVDTHCYPGYVIPPFYDSMVAKLIVWDEDRNKASARMHRALNELVVEGIKTTAPFHMEVMRNPLWLKGDFGTDFLEKWKDGA